MLVVTKFMLLLIEDFLHSLASTGWFQFFNYFMQDALFIPLVAVLALLAIVLLKDKGAKATVVVSLILVSILVTILKQIYADPRPCDGLLDCEAGYGFPSGHSSLAFTLAFATFGTKYFYAFTAFAVLVALSRVASGVHSFPQVVAGMVLGFLVSTSVSRGLLVGVEMVKKWKK